MKKIAIVLISFLILGCKNSYEDKKELEAKIEFNQSLADELKEMEKLDQIAAYIQQGEYKSMTKEQWQSFKDSVFMTHQKRLKEIFDENGFVGFDLVGKKGSQDFWLMVQHSDHDIGFQKEVLNKMKEEVAKGNASLNNYAYLVDRVQINTNEEQIYGTQFTYNEKGQAYPENISDTTGIDARRKSVGLRPMIERMNEMTESHFMMNKALYEGKGITEPQLYSVE